MSRRRVQLMKRAYRAAPDAPLEVRLQFRCEHCRQWFLQPDDKPPQRYCSEWHRREGAHRRRLGLVPDLEPGASQTRLRQLAEQVREARAGERPWSEVGER